MKEYIFSDYIKEHSSLRAEIVQAVEDYNQGRFGYLQD